MGMHFPVVTTIAYDIQRQHAGRLAWSNHNCIKCFEKYNSSMHKK